MSVETPAGPSRPVLRMLAVLAGALAVAAAAYTVANVIYIMNHVGPVAGPSSWVVPADPDQVNASVVAKWASALLLSAGLFVAGSYLSGATDGFVFPRQRRAAIVWSVVVAVLAGGVIGSAALAGAANRDGGAHDRRRVNTARMVTSGEEEVGRARAEREAAIVAAGSGSGLGADVVRAECDAPWVYHRSVGRRSVGHWVPPEPVAHGNLTVTIGADGTCTVTAA